VKVIEGAGDNDPNASQVIPRKEKQICDDDLVTQVSSNTWTKKMKLKKEHQQGKCKQRGKTKISVHIGFTPLPHKSSFSTQRIQ
jgi:hypothetical protein